MRLTEKDGTYREYIGDENTITGIKEWDNALTKKLGQLEDIEDELGIDLITLFKALKNKIYLVDCERPVPVYLIHDYFVKGFVLQGGFKAPRTYHFKDYGKTWALTREELEKWDID